MPDCTRVGSSTHPPKGSSFPSRVVLVEPTAVTAESSTRELRLSGSAGNLNVVSETFAQAGKGLFVNGLQPVRGEGRRAFVRGE